VTGYYGLQLSMTLKKNFSC